MKDAVLPRPRDDMAPRRATWPRETAGSASWRSDEEAVDEYAASFFRFQPKPQLGKPVRQTRKGNQLTITVLTMLIGYGFTFGLAASGEDGVPIWVGVTVLLLLVLIALAVVVRRKTSSD